jgi:hypothetical protein
LLKGKVLFLEPFILDTSIWHFLSMILVFFAAAGRLFVLISPLRKSEQEKNLCALCASAAKKKPPV